MWKFQTLKLRFYIFILERMIFYYQLNEDKMYPGGMLPYTSGTAIVGDGFVYIKTPDEAEFLYYRRHTGTEFWRMLIGWF